MKSIRLYLPVIFLLLALSCKIKNSKTNLTIEKQIMEQKQYPKTNNYPEADVKDEVLENKFIEAANNFHQKELTAQKAIITSRDWVVYNDFNGRPTKRNRIAVVTTKIENRCFLQHMFFQQNYDGSEFGKTYVTDVYGWKEYDCNL